MQSTISIFGRRHNMPGSATLRGLYNVRVLDNDQVIRAAVFDVAYENISHKVLISEECLTGKVPQDFYTVRFHMCTLRVYTANEYVIVEV